MEFLFFLLCVQLTDYLHLIHSGPNLLEYCKVSQTPFDKVSVGHSDVSVGSGLETGEEECARKKPDHIITTNDVIRT